MAAAAIFNLLFLTILVKWFSFGGNRLHHCKISFIYVNRVIDVCAKIQDGGCRHREL